jgi:hypothetical protein
MSWNRSNISWSHETDPTYHAIEGIWCLTNIIGFIFIIDAILIFRHAAEGFYNRRLGLFGLYFAAISKHHCSSSHKDKEHVSSRPISTTDLPRHSSDTDTPSIAMNPQPIINPSGPIQIILENFSPNTKNNNTDNLSDSVLHPVVPVPEPVSSHSSNNNILQSHHSRSSHKSSLSNSDIFKIVSHNNIC